jgi:hypothetical protein
MGVSELDTTSLAAHVVLLADVGADALIASSFGLKVPDDATIIGIQFDVRRASGFANEAQDGTVQVMRNGVPVGDNRRLMDFWPVNLTTADYGGPEDTWGTSWSALDVRSPGFGVSIQPKYSLTSGNDPVYVDSVRVIVYYKARCN